MSKYRSACLAAMVICALSFVALLFLPVSLHDSSSIASAQNPGERQAEESLRSAPRLVWEHTFQARASTYIDPHDPSDHSSAHTLPIRPGGQSALLQFDLPCEIHQVYLRGARVRSATLYVRVTDPGNGVHMEMAALKVCDPWDAPSASWKMRTRDRMWHSSGCTQYGQHCDGAVDAVNYRAHWEEIEGNGWYEFQIEDMVQDWLSDPASNHGLILAATPSSDATSRRIASAVSPDTTYRPFLQIEFEEGPAPQPTGLLLEASPRAISVCAESHVRITATVTGTFGCTVANGTLVTFETSLGEFEHPDEGEPEDTDIISIPTTNGVAIVELEPDEENRAGTAWVTATVGTASGDISQTVAVTFQPGLAERFGFGQIGTQVSGKPFEVQLCAQDCEHTPVTSYWANIVTLTTTAEEITPQKLPLVRGCAISPITLTIRGDTPLSATIAVTDGVLSGTSEPFTLFPAGPKRFALQASSEVQGCMFQPLTIEARGFDDGIMDGFIGPVNLSVTRGTVAPATTGVFTNGIWQGEIRIAPASPDAYGPISLCASADYAGRLITSCTPLQLLRKEGVLEWMGVDSYLDANRWSIVSAAVRLSDICGYAFSGQPVTFTSSLGVFASPTYQTDVSGTVTATLHPIFLMMRQRVTITAQTDGQVITRVLMAGPDTPKIYLPLVLKDVSRWLYCEQVISNGNFEQGPMQTSWNLKSDRTDHEFITSTMKTPPLPAECINGDWYCGLGGKQDGIKDVVTQNVKLSRYPVNLTISFLYGFCHTSPADFVVEIRDPEPLSSQVAWRQPLTATSHSLDGRTCNRISYTLTLSELGTAQQIVNKGKGLDLIFWMETKSGDDDVNHDSYRRVAAALVDDVSLTWCYQIPQQ